SQKDMYPVYYNLNHYNDTVKFVDTTNNDEINDPITLKNIAYTTPMSEVDTSAVNQAVKYLQDKGYVLTNNPLTTTGLKQDASDQTYTLEFKHDTQAGSQQVTPTRI
ncbi:mucin-binding protein, partial [Bartonella sp. CL63NXGY]|uniref:mucin-binding protein n=1 Tax=Bartonella sp. CL63NXGY TaxID=3243538 RepID=UPI0035D038B0